MRAALRAAGAPDYSETAVTTQTPRVIAGLGGLQGVAGHGYVDLSWNHPGTSRITSRYEIRWGPLGQALGTWTRYQRTARRFPLEYRVDGLTNAIAYRFEVRAYVRRGDHNGIVLVEGYSAAASVEATPLGDPGVDPDVAFCLLTASSVASAATGAERSDAP